MSKEAKRSRDPKEKSKKEKQKDKHKKKKEHHKKKGKEKHAKDNGDAKAEKVVVKDADEPKDVDKSKDNVAEQQEVVQEPVISEVPVQEVPPEVPSQDVAKEPDVKIEADLVQAVVEPQANGDVKEEKGKHKTKSSKVRKSKERHRTDEKKHRRSRSRRREKPSKRKQVSSRSSSSAHQKETIVTKPIDPDIQIESEQPVKVVDVKIEEVEKAPVVAEAKPEKKAKHTENKKRKTKKEEHKPSRHQKQRRSRSRRAPKRKQSTSSSSSSSSSSPDSRRRRPSKEDRILRIMQERRRGSRSKSVIRYYQRQQGKSPKNDDRMDMFWDGFQWVPKTNISTKAKAENDRVMYMTLKMRRVQLCSIPTGLAEHEVKNELSRFMIDNYLSDPNNPRPVLDCKLDEKDRSAIVELSSVEEANRLIKLERMPILEEECKILRIGEQLYTAQHVHPIHHSMLQAHNMAQAAAAAINALNNLGSVAGIDKEEMLEKAGVSTRIIKISNFLSVELAKQLETQEWADMHADMLAGFGKFGKIEDEFFVQGHQAGLGTEIGCFFLVYETKEIAEQVVQKMWGQRYNGREMRIVFIQERTWTKSYKPRQTKTETTK